jgi:hypothetical protein
MKHLKKFESLQNLSQSHYSCDECDNIWKESDDCKSCKFCGSDEIEELHEEEWNEWTTWTLSGINFNRIKMTANDISAIDKRKKELALSKGYDYLELWSSDSQETNNKKIEDFLHKKTT